MKESEKRMKREVPDEKEKKPLTRRQKTVSLLAAAGLIGIFLLGIAPMFSGEKNSGTEEISRETNEQTAKQYAAQLEEQLESVLCQIKGVGSVEVMVTLRQGYSYRYAVTEKENTDRSEDVKNDTERRTAEKSTTEQNYVLLDSKSGSVPLITATGEPEVKGVVIVCDGGGDPRTAAQVTETVRVALDLSAARINVSPRCAERKDHF